VLALALASLPPVLSHPVSHPSARNDSGIVTGKTGIPHPADNCSHRANFACEKVSDDNGVVARTRLFGIKGQEPIIGAAQGWVAGVEALQGGTIMLMLPEARFKPKILQRWTVPCLLKRMLDTAA